MPPHVCRNVCPINYLRGNIAIFGLLLYDDIVEHIRGRTFFNTSINQNIAVSRDGLGEWKTVTKSHEQALSIKLLDDLLKNAVFWKEETPKKADPNIQKVIYLK